MAATMQLRQSLKQSQMPGGFAHTRWSCAPPLHHRRTRTHPTHARPDDHCAPSPSLPGSSLTVSYGAAGGVPSSCSRAPREYAQAGRAGGGRTGAHGVSTHAGSLASAAGAQRLPSRTTPTVGVRCSGFPASPP